MAKYTFLRRLLVISGLLLLVPSCKIQYVPVETIKEVHTIDSVYLRDTTVQYRIEKEYVKEYAKDTLRLETNYSEFTAFQDSTTGMLAGTAKNKEKLIDIPMSVKEKIVYRDSVIKQEVPVPVEIEKITYKVPFFWKFFSVIGILALAYIAFRFFVFKK